MKLSDATLEQIPVCKTHLFSVTPVTSMSITEEDTHSCLVKTCGKVYPSGVFYPVGQETGHVVKTFESLGRGLTKFTVNTYYLNSIHSPSYQLSSMTPIVLWCLLSSTGIRASKNAAPRVVVKWHMGKWEMYRQIITNVAGVWDWAWKSIYLHTSSVMKLISS